MGCLLARPADGLFAMNEEHTAEGIYIHTEHTAEGIYIHITHADIEVLNKF